MMRIQAPNNGRKQWWLVRRSLLLANLAVFGLVAWGLVGEQVRHSRLTAEIGRLETEAASLEAQNFESIRLGKKFAADEAMEREARLKLGLRKPDESVIIVKGAEALQTERAALGAEPEPEGFRENPRLWWQYFFGKN